MSLGSTKYTNLLMTLHCRLKRTYKYTIYITAELWFRLILPLVIKATDPQTERPADKRN
jgi:hypothetical protein